MCYKGSLVFVLDLFDMGLTSAEGQKLECLNEEQLTFISVQRKSGNPLSIKVMLILYLPQALSLCISMGSCKSVNVTLTNFKTRMYSIKLFYIKLAHFYK
jgi:hypothetical protein